MSPAAAATPPSTPRTFGVVVPVKRIALAKSRLQPLGDEVRRELVTAFAMDTVSAVLECAAVAEVVVVTDDVPLALGLRDLGVSAVPDGESGSLNASLRQGAAELLRRRPTVVPAALCADLPGLDPVELARALSAAGATAPSFVADAAGIGTTLYVAPTLDDFAPQFGPSSRAAHLAQGAAEIRLGTIESVRRDVDTPDDLLAAAALGLGERSSWVVTYRRLLEG